MGKSTKTPVGFRFSEAELTLLEKAAKRFGDNKTKAVVEGLKMVLGQNEISKETLIAEITRRLK